VAIWSKLLFVAEQSVSAEIGIRRLLCVLSVCHWIGIKVEEPERVIVDVTFA
jgi:hypothetical protein